MIPHPALQPSEYTAALIKVLRERKEIVAGAAVLEIGIGSGVVLAALGALGAAVLAGVDLEEEAVAAGWSMLEECGFGDRTSLHCGDMWEPVAGQRFDLIVANLPHFPMDPASFGCRRPSWSAGGADGRRSLDAFVTGLGCHLRAGGRALMTHNAFVDPAATRAKLAEAGLTVQQAFETVVFIPPEKVARMTPGIRQREDGRTLFRYGPYTFGTMAVLEICAPPDSGDEGGDG